MQQGYRVQESAWAFTGSIWYKQDALHAAQLKRLVSYMDVFFSAGNNNLQYNDLVKLHIATEYPHPIKQPFHRLTPVQHKEIENVMGD